MEPQGERLVRFVDDEAGFRSWVIRHARGFVVNCHRKPTPNYLILHTTTCGSLDRHGNYTTHDFIKVCSESRSALRAWARDEVGGELTRCGECLP